MSEPEEMVVVCVRVPASVADDVEAELALNPYQDGVWTMDDPS